MVSFVAFVARYTPKHHLLVLKGGQIKLEEGRSGRRGRFADLRAELQSMMRTTLLKAQVAVQCGVGLLLLGLAMFVLLIRGQGGELDRVKRKSSKSSTFLDAPPRPRRRGEYSRGIVERGSSC